MDGEQKTTLWTGVSLVILSLVYVFVTLGELEWIRWLAVVFGVYLSIFLFVQAGIIEYFREKEYETIGFGDVVVWLTVIVAVLVFINTALLVGIIGAYIPEWITSQEWLMSLTRTMGIITGIVAGLLGIAHILSPRFK